MYIAVCDDQAEELSALTALLDQWQAERHFPLRYHTFRSAAGMLDVAQRERFSLYLLDVMMPGIDGMDAAREIRTFDDAADIVFLTSSPGFAYESYGVRALEYLLKPISGGLLFPVLDKLMLREQRPQDGLTLKAVSYTHLPLRHAADRLHGRHHAVLGLVGLEGHGKVVQDVYKRQSPPWAPWGPLSTPSSASFWECPAAPAWSSASITVRTGRKRYIRRYTPPFS